MTKRKLIVGNWKMHFNTAQASLLLHRLTERIRIYRNVEVVLAPNNLLLQPLSLQIDRRKFRLASQNAFYKDEGAYTGEISFTMLRDLVHYVIIGHSERRQYFSESDSMIRDKVSACVRNEITPILCVGETKTQRRAGETKRVLHDQISTAISNLTAHEVGDMAIAYEPVWAISTFGNELAKPGQIQEAIDYIRQQINDLYGKRASRDIRILYGGSVDDQIVRGYLELDGCDGVLVGGASLNYQKFANIVESTYKMLHEKGEDV